MAISSQYQSADQFVVPESSVGKDSFVFFRIPVSLVLSHLQLLNVMKSTGPDGLSARFLRKIAVEIATPLSQLYNASLSAGVFPLNGSIHILHRFTRRDFKEQLKWYLARTEADKKSDLAKIGILLSYIGKDTRDIYKTLEWTAEGDNNKFDKVLEAFQRCCSRRKNIIYDHYGFWTIQQDDHETIDVYLTRIQIKIDLREYDKDGWLLTVCQELIRDKFVFSITDDNLKELLHEADVSLARAVEMVQQAESSK